MAEGGSHQGQKITIEHHYHFNNEGDKIATNIGQQTNITGEIRNIGITASADVQQDGSSGDTGEEFADDAQKYTGASDKQGFSSPDTRQLNNREAQPSSKLDEGYIRICDDVVMNNVSPLQKGTYVYEGYQEHVSKDGCLKKLPVAIKKIMPSEPKHRIEVQHLVTLAAHQNVVRIIRSKEHEAPFGNALFIVMELCSLQNLHNYLKENRKSGAPFDFKKTLKFTKHLVKGMKHIHDNGIVHRDVKPENILLSTDKTQLKFSDFGIGKNLREGRTSTNVTTQGQGTKGYMAPETHFADKVTKSSDIFSLGVTIFELWSNGISPYGELHLQDFNIRNNISPDFSSLLIRGPFSDGLLDLIKRMLHHDPTLRPNIDDVLNHISSIIAKIKSEEELMKNSNLGERTPSTGESIQRQSSISPPHNRLGSETSEEELLTGLNLEKRTPSTRGSIRRQLSMNLPHHRQWSVEKAEEESTTIRLERSRSAVRADFQRKRRVDTLKQKFEESARRNVEGSSTQETADALMKDSKFNDAIALYERLPITEYQQMKLLECYFQVGRNGEIMKCVENMKMLVTEYSGAKAGDVFKLGLDNLEKSAQVKAIVYFACAAKLYAFESNADEAVRLMCHCLFTSSKVLFAMIKESDEKRDFGREVGMKIMNDIKSDVMGVNKADPSVKAQMEARCLNVTGICYRALERHKKAIELYKQGIDIMKCQFCENSSKYHVYGDLLHNMGFAYYELRNYSEAESLDKRAFDAYKRLAGSGLVGGRCNSKKT